MTRLAGFLLASLGCLAGAGCNAIFGIQAGSSSNGGGGEAPCGGYNATGNVAWALAPGGQANLQPATYGESDNCLPQGFDTAAGVSTFKFGAGGPVGSQLCNAAVVLVLTGAPVAGTTYQLVDGTTCDATLAVNAGGAAVACLQLLAPPAIDGGDCSTESPFVFASAAGKGTVTVGGVTKVGPDTHVAVTASAVVLSAVPASGATGAVGLQLGVTAECFQGL